MNTIDATMFAVITNRCTDVMQQAAVAYFASQPADREYHTKKAFETFRDLADRLGFTIEQKQLEAAE